MDPVIINANMYNFKYEIVALFIALFLFLFIYFFFIFYFILSFLAVCYQKKSNY